MGIQVLSKRRSNGGPRQKRVIQVTKGNVFLSLNEYCNTASQLGSGTEQVVQEGCKIERTLKQRHEKFAKPSQLEMKLEEQDAEIRQAFYNDETMPKGMDLHDTIGKIANLKSTKPN